MATNEDILKYLNDMKNQASASNEALRKDVKEQMNTLSTKIDNVKKEADEKNMRNEIKMKGILSRLDSIEKNINENKNKCEKGKEERRKQVDRVNTFKETVGLVDIVDDTPREKTWSELVDQSRKEDVQDEALEQENFCKIEKQRREGEK